MMDQNDRRVIDDLFTKVREAERQSPPRDPEAEAHIGDHLRRNPAAPYYLAQAVVIQEQALERMHARIQQLEGELATRVQPAAQPAGGGGLFGGLFGNRGATPAQPSAAPAGPVPRTGSVPSSGPWGAQPSQGYGQLPGQGQPAGGMGLFNRGPGAMGQQRGGFMAGALGTAVAVAGGMVLGNAIANMMTGGGEAQAAPAPEPAAAPEPAHEPAGYEDPGAGDFGGGFGDEEF